MATYKIPGVYIEEISKLPPSIVSVPTAIPIFIGYTQKAQLNEIDDLKFTPKKITSLQDYERYFGLPMFETGISIELDNNTSASTKATVKIRNAAPYLMHYSLQLYFANGGGSCYIVSTGGYNVNLEIIAADLATGLDAAATNNEPTLILFPDAIHLPTANEYYQLYNNAMVQCALLKNRFAIMDVWVHIKANNDPIYLLRQYPFAPHEILKYGAAYYPTLSTTIKYAYEDESVSISATNSSFIDSTLAQLKLSDRPLHNLAKNALDLEPMNLPACCAVAGIYVQVDRERGVWKAPTYVNIVATIHPTLEISMQQQEKLNVDESTGRSINAIRSFTGKGAAIIWGARTLLGNDNEWRYIPVRRLINLVETSVKYGIEQFVFEPNDANTWVRIRSMIENYLTQLWRDGAFAGVKPTEAFFAKIGIGQTMNTQDILEGRMIIEIGLAAVRPAEFIIVKIEQKMAQK